MSTGSIKFGELLEDASRTAGVVEGGPLPLASKSASLARPGRRSSFQSIGVALWLISALSLLVIVVSCAIDEPSRAPLVGNMLSRSNPVDRAIPNLILILFAWVLVDLLLKARHVNREHAATKMFRMYLAVTDAEQYEPPAFNVREPRASRRADLISECSRRDPSSLHDTVPAAASLDASTLSAGYTPLHVYAWILPVLGFIGTANGMASSIDGFKAALRNGQGQVDALASQLGETVIPGLSAAFETTILALAASVVTYLCTSALRSWDQQALDELDRLCILLLSRIPQPEGKEGEKIVGLLDQISGQLREHLRITVESLSGLSDLRQAICGAALEAAPQIESAATAINEAASELASASRELRETAGAPYHVMITRGERS